MSIAPIVAEVDVGQAPARAFDLFTSRIGDWWPGKTIGARPHVAIVIEPRAEGRWYERDAEGDECQWGKVLDWDPPRRVLLGWQLDQTFTYNPDFLTEVEISFTALAAGGTRVRLEHRNLERFGTEADRIAAMLRGGWQEKLDGFCGYFSEKEKVS